MNLILLGPPGAGKGTLAHLLKEQSGMLHISTGDIFREEMNQDTDLGKEVKKFIEDGELVPDSVVVKIIEKQFMNNHKKNQGILLDGFPRTTAQAQDLDKILDKTDKFFDYTVYLEATLPVITQRLTGRRICRNCGALFHAVNKPPKRKDICDDCGGPLYQRPDDNEETIKKRMEVYLKNTTPIIEYYQNQGKLKKIDADKNAEEVCENLIRIIDEDRKNH